MLAPRATSHGRRGLSLRPFQPFVHTSGTSSRAARRYTHLKRWRDPWTIRYTFAMRQDENVSQRLGRVSSTRPSPSPAIDPFVARWIRRALASDPPRARSLIVTVWGDALAPHGGIVWLAGLIRLMTPFGINERLVRTSVFRLVRDGWLAAQSHGRRSRYRLTREGMRRFDQAHHRIYTTANPVWDGEWEVVLAPPDAARQKLRDELAWEGFRSEERRVGKEWRSGS